MAEAQRLIKITLLVHRKEGTTEEEFHHHWTVVHPPIVNDWLKKHGIIRYVQYHTPSSVRDQAKNSLKVAGALVSNMLDYDGLVELLMPDVKCFDEARSDPYYEEHVKPDEDSFIDASKGAIIVGYEEQKF